MSFSSVYVFIEKPFATAIGNAARTSARLPVGARPRQDRRVADRIPGEGEHPAETRQPDGREIRGLRPEEDGIQAPRARRDFVPVRAPRLSARRSSAWAFRIVPKK